MHTVTVTCHSAEVQLGCAQSSATLLLWCETLPVKHSLMTANTSMILQQSGSSQHAETATKLRNKAAQCCRVTQPQCMGQVAWQRAWSHGHGTWSHDVHMDLNSHFMQL